MRQRDLAEVLAVVEAHRASLSIPDSSLQQAPMADAAELLAGARADLALLALERLHQQRQRVVRRPAARARSAILAHAHDDELM